MKKYDPSLIWRLLNDLHQLVDFFSDKKNMDKSTRVMLQKIVVEWQTDLQEQIKSGNSKKTKHNTRLVKFLEGFNHIIAAED